MTRGIEMLGNPPPVDLLASILTALVEIGLIGYALYVAIFRTKGRKQEP